MCGAFTANCGYAKALLFLLGTCIVQMQSVWVSFAAQKGFSISRQKQLSMPAMRVSVSGAHFSF